MHGRGRGEGFTRGRAAARQEGGAAARCGAAQGCPTQTEQSRSRDPAQAVRTAPREMRPKGNAFHFLQARARRMLSHGAEHQWGGGVRAGGFMGDPLQYSLSPSLGNSPSLAPVGGAGWGLCTPGWLLSPGHPLCSVCLWRNSERILVFVRRKPGLSSHDCTFRALWFLQRMTPTGRVNQGLELDDGRAMSHGSSRGTVPASPLTRCFP